MFWILFSAWGSDMHDLTKAAFSVATSGILATPRLTLRRLEFRDAPVLARLANERSIAEQLRLLPHPYALSDAVGFIQVSRQSELNVFLITHERRPIGVISIDRSCPGRPELGYWLGVAYWGQGFATEAAWAVSALFFDEADDPYLYAGARVANPASRNVLEKCGFQWSGVVLTRVDLLGSSVPVDRFRLSRVVWSAAMRSQVVSRPLRAG